MKKNLIIFFLILFGFNYSFASAKTQIKPQEIESIFFENFFIKKENFSINEWQNKLPKNSEEKKELLRLNKKRWNERIEKGEKRTEKLKKRLKIKGIAECLYKDGDVMESGNPEQYKQCSAKIIRAVFTRSEMAEKRRPGDIFYGLSAVAFLTTNQNEYFKFIKNFIYEDGDKPLEDMMCDNQVEYDNIDQKYWMGCSVFRGSVKKKIDKFKKDPTNEKILGHELTKFIKNVRMISDVKEKLGTDNFALLGDMLNDSVVNVEKNNIGPEFNIRRSFLKKYSLILNKIKRKLNEEEYKSLNKDVLKLSKVFENLSKLNASNNDIVKNIDEAVNIISKTNEFIQINSLKAKNNEKEKLLALASIKFMQSLIDSILGVIPDKYYVEAKLLDRNLFDESDLEELELILDRMVKKNKEIKIEELNKSMNKIDKFINPTVVVKKLNNLGMVNQINETFTQNTAFEIAKNELKDNLDKDILQSAKKILEEMDQNDLNELAKEVTEAAQEVSKEVASQASTAAWATTKPGNYNVRHLIQASRQGKISWDIGRR
jgi:hypothetical protein